jgi:hypothetical protein
MGYDWKGWSILFYLFGAMVATFNVVSPAEIGISPIALKWILIFSSIGLAVSGKMGASWLGKSEEPLSENARANLKTVLPFVLIAGLGTQACASKQYPTLPPESQRQIDATEMGKRVNSLMDTVIEAESKGLMPTATTRVIVQWCVDADKTLLLYPSGWGPTLAQGWLSLKNNPAVKPLLLVNQYVASAVTMVDIALAIWTPKQEAYLEVPCSRSFSYSLRSS